MDSPPETPMSIQAGRRGSLTGGGRGSLTGGETKYSEEKKKYKEQKRIMKMDSRDIQGKLKEGPLKIRSTLRNWHKFYGVLRPGALTIYSPNDTKKWIGTILLAGSAISNRPTEKKGFAFKITSIHGTDLFAKKGPEGNTYFNINFLPHDYCILRVPDEDDRDGWVQSLEEAKTQQIQTPSRRESTTDDRQMNRPPGFVLATPLRAVVPAAHSGPVSFQGADIEASEVIDETRYYAPKNSDMPPSLRAHDTNHQRFELEKETMAALWAGLKDARPQTPTAKLQFPPAFHGQRSVIDCLSDQFYHSYLLSATRDESNAEKRFLSVLAWFFSTLQAKPAAFKMPIQSLQGEVFRCSFDDASAAADPDYTRIFMVAEQVSSSTSAVHVTDRKGGWVVQGSLSTTGTFYGDTVELDNSGSYQVTLLGHKEEYVITPPTVAVSGMLTGTPWWELDGQTTITCATTGYRAEINYTPGETGQWYHLENKIQGNFVKGEERIGSITGAWDGTVAVDVGQSQPQELFSNSDTFRKRRLRRRLVPVEQQKSFEDQAAFFDSEITWMDVATNLKRQNYPAAASARNAVTKACPQGGAPVFFSEVEIEEGGSRWSYQHASMSAAWNNDSDCYVCERDGVISTLNKDMIGDQMAAAGVGGAAMSPDLSVFSPAMSAVRGGAMPNRRQSRLNTDESLYDETSKGMQQLLQDNKILMRRVQTLEETEALWRTTYMPLYVLLFQLIMWLASYAEVAIKNAMDTLPEGYL